MNRRVLIQHKFNNGRFRTDHNSQLLNLVITKAYNKAHGISSVISLSAGHMTVQYSFTIYCQCNRPNRIVAIYSSKCEHFSAVNGS